MRRREFIMLVGSAAIACPLGARAQERARVRSDRRDYELRRGRPGRASSAFSSKGSAPQAGWIEGNNIQIEVRWAPANPTVCALTRPSLSTCR